MMNDETCPPVRQTIEASSCHAGWHFDNSYARLPEVFHVRVSPTPVAQPRLAVFNRPLARSLGLDPAAFTGPETAAFFTGNQIFPGAEPIAQAYAGHQFGNLARLGDGRAILLGEQMTPSGERFDIQLKGAGPKLGLFSVEPEDAALTEELLSWMHQTRADYTHTFRNLRPHATSEPASPVEAAFAAWHQRWTERLARQPQSGTEVLQLMNAHNPAVIPRNHVVEAALTAATTGNDLAPLERLNVALAKPYDDTDQPADLLTPPPAGTPTCRTFCGT